MTSLRLKVARIIPAAGLRRFALRPTQAVPRDALLNLADVQQLLKQPNEVNAILVGDREPLDRALPAELAEAHQQLEKVLPTLADYGLTIRQAPLGYFLLESDRMLLEPAVVKGANKAFGPLDAQAAFTYLANSLADGDREIPYSTVTAIDFAPARPVGGFVTPEGQTIAPLTADEICRTPGRPRTWGQKSANDWHGVFSTPKARTARWSSARLIFVWPRSWRCRDRRSIRT